MKSSQDYFIKKALEKTQAVKVVLLSEEFTQAELDEYVQNSRMKLEPYITADTRMLEVGIGSGTLAYQLAPMCKNYDGTDISELVLKKLEEMSQKKGIDNMSLYNYAADEIDQIQAKYDIILMSSVTEYFSGYNYMRKVIKKCIDMIDKQGVILFADVFDLAKKEEYRQSVLAYAEAHPGCRYKRDFSHELFIPHEYWKDIANTFPEIERVLISDKLGTIKNEINTFRYDVILEVNHDGKESKKDRQERELYKYQIAAL